MTDGIINDLQASIDEIVRGSDLPLSIIIVGVGQADFDQMEQLDGDVTPLFSNKLNRYRNRDIVQIVPFRSLQGNPQALAKEVLKVVPKQLTDYFSQKDIKPYSNSFKLVPATTTTVMMRFVILLLFITSIAIPIKNAIGTSL